MFSPILHMISRPWNPVTPRRIEFERHSRLGQVADVGHLPAPDYLCTNAFYGVTLGHAKIPERIVYARAPRTLLVVLSTDEVVRFLEAVPSLKTRTALTTAYAAGLRASETVGLKVGDIDSERGVILVHHGKDGKDRTVMLSAQLLQILLVYWRLAKPQGWLFPGHDADRPIDVQVLYSACRSARAAAGIDKRVTALLPEKNHSPRSIRCHLQGPASAATNLLRRSRRHYRPHHCHRHYRPHHCHCVGSGFAGRPLGRLRLSEVIRTRIYDSCSS